MPHEKCWEDQEWFLFTKHMKLHRFCQIRAVLHINSNKKMSTSNDLLFKVCPLLNCLKVMFGRHISIGLELALDEASIATRSGHGMILTFCNPTKPAGKCHFWFHLLCCTVTFACIRIQMHTRDTSDATNGFVPTNQRPADAVENKRTLLAMTRRQKMILTRKKNSKRRLTGTL